MAFQGAVDFLVNSQTISLIQNNLIDKINGHHSSEMLVSVFQYSRESILAQSLAVLFGW
jgi:hypothetical protein